MPGPPYLPLYVGDLLAATQSWRGEEQALYVRLLMLQWSAGCIPNGPQNIAKAVRYNRNNFARLWPRVSAKFVQSEHGLINLRLEEHRSHALDIKRRNSERATLAAHKRWDAPSNAPSIGNGMLQASGNDAPSIVTSHAIQSNPSKNKNLEGEPPVDNSTKRALLPNRGKGASDAPSTQRESPGAKAWLLLVASDGRIRPPEAQHALDQIAGGWPTVRMRTPQTEPALRSQFIAAFESVNP